MEGYKCYNCYNIINLDENGDCPNCHTKKLLKKMCEYDTGVCRCSHDTHPEVKLCPKCNEPICPECLSHDVVGVSRVTGYLSDVGGWRSHKREELKDRMRYNVGDGIR